MLGGRNIMYLYVIIDHPRVTSHLFEVEAASENTCTDAPTGWQKERW